MYFQGDKVMKNCELCNVPATAYCDSDRASLCWDCDFKVHGANFLVARHSRTLLCHVCQSITPWRASGAKLGNAVSLCESCAGVARGSGDQKKYGSEGGNDNETDIEDDLDEDDQDMTDDDDEKDYQVVPWASSAPPPATSPSSSKESISSFEKSDRDISESISTVPVKRIRKNGSDLKFQVWRI